MGPGYPAKILAQPFRIGDEVDAILGAEDAVNQHIRQRVGHAFDIANSGEKLP